MVVAAALYCLIFQLRLPGLLPSEADYAAVQAVLEKERAPGDVVLLYPWWTERARLYAPEDLPVVGYQGSDSASLPHHGRIWVLAQPGLPRASYGSFMETFGARRTATGAARDFGPLRLALFDNGRYREPKVVASSAVDRLAVYQEVPGGERRACGWDGRAHRCPGGYVATEWHETKFEPRRCLRFFPPGGPVRLVAELSGAPAAAGATLEAGFIWDRGAFPGGVTNFTLEVQGGESRTLAIPAGLEPTQRVDVGAIPAGASVRMTVQADNPQGREMCADFTLWGRP